MKIVLKTPFDPGMNDPGKTYPEVYITQMTDNPSGQNFVFIYEAGQFETTPQSTDEQGNVTPSSTVWVKGPGCLSQMASVTGEDYANAQNAPVMDSKDSAYQSIRRILYTKLISMGLVGQIVST